jgi:hypothetical protein
LSQDPPRHRFPERPQRRDTWQHERPCFDVETRMTSVQRHPE